MAAISTADAPAGAPEQSFVYDGRLGELYAIFLKNLLLTIVTLGIYRFWGKTRIRRYVWSHVGFQGERFEYTGTGGELFKGFLIVLGFLVIAGLLRTGIELWSGPDSGATVLAQILFLFAVVYLVFVAQYSAQRYRLTRTLWRGIRGGMTGSAWAYGGKALLYNAISGFTGWLAQPWASFRLIESRLNNSYFGDAKAQASLRASEVLGRYFAGYGLMIVIGMLVAGAGIAIMAATGALDAFRVLIEASAAGDKPDPTGIDIKAIGVALFMFYVILVAWAVFGATFAFAWYWSGVAREIADRLAVSELRFKSLVTGGSLIALYLGNVLILIFTVGLGLPIVLHRTLRFATTRYHVLGELDATRLAQSTLPRPRTGEGLLEAFDPGLF
jgi:uncharacterized membrane protein YjgN (DUF898 family)